MARKKFKSAVKRMNKSVLHAFKSGFGLLEKTGSGIPIRSKFAVVVQGMVIPASSRIEASKIATRYRHRGTSARTIRTGR